MTKLLRAEITGWACCASLPRKAEIVSKNSELSRIASRYGRCGRKVFEANQDPIVSAMQLFECVPFTDVDKILVEPLRAWLKDPPKFDPEGWALPLFGKF